MKKKIVVIIGVTVVLFVVLISVNNFKSNKAINENDNPYGKTDLAQGTIDQLSDRNYDNQILPDELNEKVGLGEAVTVYFYSPICSFCKKTTPYLVPLTEDLKINMKKLNLLEFPEGVEEYELESTPTVIHFDDGEIVASIIGQHTEEEYTEFFNEYVLD